MIHHVIWQALESGHECSDDKDDTLRLDVVGWSEYYANITPRLARQANDASLLLAQLLTKPLRLCYPFVLLSPDLHAIPQPALTTTPTLEELCHVER